MPSKCIGIISYLPNKWNLRNDRLTNLRTLIDKINNLFNLPIFILAQSYKELELDKIKENNVTILNYPNGLGIALARETLRKYFLKSTNYDVIILLDDDSIIKGDSGIEYLKQIDDNPNKILSFHGSIHKLMAVYRNVYEMFSYDLINTPDKHLAYEDALFYFPIVVLHNELVYEFKNTGLDELSSTIHDKNSSWSTKVDKDLVKFMSRNTNSIIKQRTGKDLKEIYKMSGIEMFKVTEENI